MKKELIMLGSMVAMSAALSSCCCKRWADVAYKQKRQNAYETAPRVVNYKDGGTVCGTPGYIEPTSAEGITLTTPSPVRQNRCSQVRPTVHYVPEAPVHPAVAAMGIKAAVSAHAKTQNMSFSAGASNAQGGYSTGSGYSSGYGYGVYDTYDGDGHTGCSNPILILHDACLDGSYVTQPCSYVTHPCLYRW